MHEIASLIGWIVLGFVALIAFVVALYGLPMGAPSQESCVALWNAPRNGVARAEVAAHGYATADIA